MTRSRYLAIKTISLESIMHDRHILSFWQFSQLITLCGTLTSCKLSFHFGFDVLRIIRPFSMLRKSTITTFESNLLLKQVIIIDYYTILDYSTDKQGIYNTSVTVIVFDWYRSLPIKFCSFKTRNHFCGYIYILSVSEKFILWFLKPFKANRTSFTNLFECDNMNAPKWNGWLLIFLL